MMSGFKQFLMRGNAIDLAVGVIVGAAFGGIVDSLVKDIISPLLGLMGGSLISRPSRSGRLASGTSSMRPWAS